VNNKAIVTIVQGDTWSGVYLNGKLRAEGNNLDIYDTLLEAYNINPKFKVDHKGYIDSDWLEEVGNLPENLDDVQLNI
jgi:hypothetical protein